MAKKTDDEATEDGEAKGGKSKLKLIAIILPVLLLVGGGAYYFLVMSKSGTTAAASATADGATPAADCAEGDEECLAAAEGATPEPSSTEVPGKTVAVEPVTINLQSGHFLKVGLLLQATAAAGEEVVPGKAADCMIAEFSGKTVDELATAEGREAAKKELLKAIKKAYEKKVYEIYYTTFVMN